MSNQQKENTREELVEKYIAQNIKNPNDQNRFREYANSLGLNPYTDDIYYYSSGNKGTIIVAYDIYLAKAWETGVFLGIDFEEVYEKDILICVKAVGKRNVNGQVATLSFNAYLNEYGVNNTMWKKMPVMMLRKCAVANVVRQLFADRLKLPYISEEMEQAYDNQNNINTIDLKDVPKGDQQKVTDKTTPKPNTTNTVKEHKEENEQEITNEQKAQKSLEWVVEFYNILVEKGEQSLSDKQIDLILKATDKNLPNVKNSPTKDMLLGLALYYSTAGGVENPLDDRSPNMGEIKEEYPEELFSDVDNPFGE